MPEVAFTLRWPDGESQRLMSPSRTIERALVAGGLYPAGELVRRASEALAAGNERVRAKHGFACSGAAQALDAMQARARAFASDALVEVKAMRRAPSPRRFPAPDTIDGHHDVVVIGAGQAGLAASHGLVQRGIEHLVLERDRVACSWQTGRWDAFCLVTPNHQCRLPGHPYAGEDPDGFMVKDAIIEYVEDYAASFGPPLCEGVDVGAVSADPAGFALQTSHGTVTAGQVVLAVGGYHVPTKPRLGERLPADVTQLHSSAYRNPESLPDGAVLVVGTGQSGAQIAEDLHIAGRDVHLCVGTAPRVARFYRGRDCVAWLEDIGHYDMPITEHPEGLGARREANHYVTGRDGGHDIDLRAFAREGMELHGRLIGVRDAVAHLAADLPENLDAADATMRRIKDTIDRWIDEQGIDAPTEAGYEPVWRPDGDGSGRLDLREEDIRTVVWATGFRSDWSWVALPAFDGSGYPVHERGVTSIDGLYVLGLPWLHTWGSGRFAGVGRDAEFVAGHVAARADGLRAAA